MSPPSFNDPAAGVKNLIKMRDELRAEVEELEIQVQSDDHSLKLHSPVRSGIVKELEMEVKTTRMLVGILKDMLEEKQMKEGKGEKAGHVNKHDEMEEDDNEEGDDHDEKEGKEKAEK